VNAEGEIVDVVSRSLKRSLKSKLKRSLKSVL